MYGLFPALMETQRFRADQDQRQQEMAMRQQDQVMRQRQMTMQEEQHKLQNQEMGLRLGRMKGEDAAAANLADLQKRGIESQQFNGTGLMRPVDDREMNSAMGQYAIAHRDPKGMLDARNANRMLDVTDEAKKLSQDPEFQAKVLNYVHKDNRFPAQYVPATFDPKTNKQLTPARFDIDGKKPIELSQGDVQQFAYGAALMNKGFTQEGLKHIETINKDLAAMVQRAEQRSTQAAGLNRQELNDLRDNNRGDKQLEAQMAHWKAMEARAGGGGGGGPKIDPKLIAEYNNLVAEYQAAVDSGDTKREAALRKQLPIKQAQMATAMGKTMTLRDPPAGRPERAVTPQDRLKMATTILESPEGQGMNLQGALQMVDQITGAQGGAAPMSEVEQLRAALKAQNGGAPAKSKPGLQKPAAKLVTYETMPLDVLQGYTGTSPEARAVYMRRMQDKERGQQPRFWVNPNQGAQSQEFGLDRGY